MGRFVALGLIIQMDGHFAALAQYGLMRRFVAFGPNKLMGRFVAFGFTKQMDGHFAVSSPI